LSRERVGKRLDKASRLAEQQNNAAASSELGIAKVFGHIAEGIGTPAIEWDMGVKLLQSVGLRSSSPAAVTLAHSLVKGVLLHDREMIWLSKTPCFLDSTAKARTK
jgi:hypothetical protein